MLQAPPPRHSSDSSEVPESTTAAEGTVAAVKEGAAAVANGAVAAMKHAKTKAERQNAALKRRLNQPAARMPGKARKSKSWVLTWPQEHQLFSVLLALLIVAISVFALWFMVGSATPVS